MCLVGRGDSGPNTADGMTLVSRSTNEEVESVWVFASTPSLHSRDDVP
jgi:hypothetical protein